MDNHDKMLTKPVGKLILTLGIPTTITLLITNIYNLVDTFFVSQLGDSASGAIGIVFGLMGIIQALGFLFGQGAGSNISRKLGAGDKEGASRFASTSFFLALGFGILISIFGLIFLTPLMRLFGSTKTILPYARTYAIYIFLAAPAMVLSFVLNNILRFEGKATLALIGLATGAVLNIGGDALFMYGFDMGIEGAGLSTAISQYIGVSILLFMFLSHKTQSCLSFKKFSKDMKIISSIVAVGFPSLIRQGFASASTIILNNICSSYGDQAIAAMSIVSRCSMFIFCIGLGVGQGFQPVAGFNFGAKKYSRLRKGFFFTLISGTIVLGTLATFGLIFSEQIISVFRDNPEVVEIGTFALRMQCIALIFIPLSVCGNMLFQSIGKAGFAAILSALRSGVLYIPLLLILSSSFKMKGIQLSQPIADVFAGLLTIPFLIHFFKILPKEDK